MYNTFIGEKKRKTNRKADGCTRSAQKAQNTSLFAPSPPMAHYLCFLPAHTRIVSWPDRSHENTERSIRTVLRTQRTAASPPKIPISQAGHTAAAAGWGGPQTGGRRDRQGRAAAPSTVQAPGVPLPRAIVRLNVLRRHCHFLLSFFRHADFGTSSAVPLSSNRNLQFFLINSTHVQGF